MKALEQREQHTLHLRFPGTLGGTGMRPPFFLAAAYPGAARLAAMVSSGRLPVVQCAQSILLDRGLAWVYCPR